MYFPSAQSAIILLSLGASILGAIINVPPSTQPSVNLQVRAGQREAVPDITKHGYTILETQPQVADLLGKRWTIKHGNIQVAILGIDTAQKKLNIISATNDNDPDENKIKTRAIILSAWETITGLEAKELAQITWCSIVNGAMVRSMERALAAVPDKGTRVLPSHTAAYTEIMGANPAGSGIAKMLVEFVEVEGRSVVAVDIKYARPRSMTFWLGVSS